MNPPFIVTTSIRNEEWILDHFLSTTSLWADRILILDSGCTDRSLEICSQYPQVTLLPYSPIYQQSPFARRKVLFDTVREWNEKSIVWTIDADEIVGAPILNQTHRNQIIERLESPGSCAELPWIMLWKNPTLYRAEKGGIWSDRWMRTLYWDDRKMKIHQDDTIHRSRVPLGFYRRTVSLPETPLLHYQFVAWERTQYKQAYYRILDWDNSKQTRLSSLAINTLYATTRESHGAETQCIPDSWISEYLRRGINLRHFNEDPLPWFVKSIFNQFLKNGLNYYASIDIWDLPWLRLQAKLIKINPEFSKLHLKDPRNRVQKITHSLIQCAGRYGTRIALRLYRFLEFIVKAVKRD